MIDQSLPTPAAPVTPELPPQPISSEPSVMPPGVSPQIPDAQIPPQPITPEATQITTPIVPVAENVPTPIIEQHPIATHPEEYQHQKMKAKVLKIISLIITAGLTLEGLKGLYESMYFVLVEFQHFEEALVEHRIEGGLINQLALKAGLLVFSTAVSLFFAIQMSFHHTKVLKILHILAGVLALIVTYAVMHYANSIDILGLVSMK